MATQKARCIHARPRSVNAAARWGASLMTRVYTVSRLVEPSEACRKPRNDVCSTIRSRPSGESRSNVVLV